MENPLSIQIHNRERFENNQSGEWLRLPATAEQLHAAMERVGITADNPQHFFINGIESPIEAVQRLPFEQVQAATVDEFNFLAAKLEALDPKDIKTLNAAGEVIAYWDDVHHLTEYANNPEFFVLIPDAFNHIQLGEHYLNSEMIQMPEEWIGAINIEMLGQLAAEHEKGQFTEQGYIVESGDAWEPVNEVAEQYRIMSFPQPERDNPNIDYDAISTRAPAVAVANPPEQAQPQPVIPIMLESEKPADKLKEITDRLENGIAGIFESEQYADYLKTLSKFHNYSLNNTILIAMQKPDASHIAGFNAWKNDFERNVRKGEKGIKILAPSPFKVKKEMDKIDPDTQRPITGKDGKPVTEEVEITIPAFKVVSVFDVSQTEGKELPNIGVDTLTGNVEQYKDFFAALEKASPVPVAFENIERSANGYYHLEDKRIAIKEGMSELQTLKTAIHEIAHARLHDIDLNAPKDEQNRIDRRTREVQAESIAYTVCQHYGLDTSDYSFGYVAGWSSGKELTELKASLDTIRTAAAELITEIDSHFAELQQDREQTAEQSPVFESLPPEQQQALSDEVQATLQFFVDNDLKDHGELTDGTLEAIAVQGYAYNDGKLEKLTEPQPSAEQEPPAPEPAQPEPTTAVKYYPINEEAARRAKEAISYSDYKPGSATAEYRQSVDKAVEIAARQKAIVDPMYHEKIDGLLDTYARKLAENMNHGYAITARVPSVLIAGPANFPVRAKEKQNASSDSNMREWQDIQGLLEKIRSTGMGGISADDHNAIPKLQEKLAGLEQSQETMKAVNAYFRKHNTLDGCPNLTTEQIARMKADMSRSWRGASAKPFEAYALQNNNAEIHRVKARIEELTHQEEAVLTGWQFEGGKVEVNKPDNRLQVFFDGKPDEATRAELKSNGFKWAPSVGAWQRQLNANAFYAANAVKSIRPLTGEKPTDLQKRAHRETQQEQTAERQPGYEKWSEPVTAANAPNNPGVPSDDISAYISHQGDTFSIYQLKHDDSTRDYRFEPLERLQSAGLAVAAVNYEPVYTAPITPDTGSLDKIFEKFNIDHPEDFTGHSLSVSDIVTLNRDGKETAHYVDSFGFKEVPEFLQPPAPDNFLSGEKIQTPRGSFSLTNMTAEQMKAAGYGFHHSSDDGKYHIMGNGTRAFAIVNDINPLRTAEMSTEQNYNMIDGIPNNRPSVDELEAKAKVGEQINLSDLAAAIKADKAAERDGGGSDTGKKPSIRAQLKSGREQTERSKPAPDKSKGKNNDLEV